MPAPFLPTAPRFTRLALLFTGFFVLPVSAQQAPADPYQEGVASLSASKFPEAEAAFRKAADAEPDAPGGYLGVSLVYAAQKKHDEAIRFLQEQTAKYPARADLHLLLGDAAMRAGQYDLALSAFRAALPPQGEAVNPSLFVPRSLSAGDLTPKGETGIHVRLAEALQLKKQPVESAAEWQKVLALVPGNTGVMTNLAMQLDLAGKKADAIRIYREALLLEPANPVILNNLAFLIADTGGDLYEALRYARRANTFSPGSATIMDTEAWVALKQGFIDDALGTLLRVVEAEPANVEFRKHLSTAITQRGVRSPVSDELLKALNRPPVPGDEEVIRSLLKNLTAEGVANRK